MRKIALITGASGGIGSAIALKFAANGYAVAIIYHTNRESIDQLTALFPAAADYLALPCDLTDPDSVSDMIEQVHQRLGRISVLVNCAGCALPQKLFADTSDEEYHHIFNTNVLGTMRLTKLLTEDLRLQTGSVIYSASKAALIGFTKSLAKELAPCGVTVNAVAPGFIQTAMNAHLSPEDTEAFRLETPLERLGTPEDVADAVFYLANARFVTGQFLCCDGGYTV